MGTVYKFYLVLLHCTLSCTAVHASSVFQHIHTNQLLNPFHFLSLTTQVHAKRTAAANAARNGAGFEMGGQGEEEE